MNKHEYSKCPLCGETPSNLVYGVGDGETSCIFCKCGLSTIPIAYHLGIQKCWAAWEELVGKFPPLMRVHPGDKIRYDAGCEEFDGIVVGIERDEHNDRHLLVESMCYAGTDRVYPYQIIKWPWELGKAREEVQP